MLQLLVRETNSQNISLHVVQLRVYKNTCVTYKLIKKCLIKHSYFLLKLRNTLLATNLIRI